MSDDLLALRWGWYWRETEDGEADCGITAETRPGHAYAIMRCPRYVTEKKWRAFATHVCDLHNATLERDTAHIATRQDGSKLAVMVTKVSA